MGRLLKLEKDYIYELYEGNNPGEYEINFPQLSITLNINGEDKLFYKRNIKSEDNKKIMQELEEMYPDEAERKEYIASDEGKRDIKERIQKASYKTYYTIIANNKDIYGMILSECEKHNIKEETPIESMNVEIE